MNLRPKILQITPSPLRKGERSDKYAERVHQRVRGIVTSYRGSLQPIHVHCFTGTADEVDRWTKKFHDVYFGFTALVGGFDETQKEALRAVSMNRLLLESDSPHLAPGEKSINNPAYLGEVAALVAAVLGRTTEQVLTVMADNARRLYKM